MAGVIKSWLAMLACAFLTWSNLHAASVDQFYPYGITIDESLDIGDDVASDKYNLDIPIVFYSQRKSEVWISTNGLISFDGPLKEYAGELFPLGREVVAPFYADIDTTSSGDVFYRETKEEAELNQAASDISKVFRPDEAFQPASLLIVTWVNVGAFYQRFTKLNTFQLVIATDAFRSYAFFIYMDNSINWIQADLKPEIAEVSAQAGFDSGAQQYGPIVVPGSGFEEALNWDKESNTGIPGVWMYKIGYLTVIEQPEVNIMTTTPSPALPGPDTNECPQGCSANAVCIEGCCVCKLGYYGNGISCLGDDALWVNGKVYGTVNEEDISNAGMYVYVAVDEARTYTAISKLPPLTGYPLQILVILGELMGWLFAAASTGTSENGFSITGGIMNYSATMDFGSERVRLDVEMSGVTSDGTPQDMQIPPKDMIVRITGTLPVNTVGSQATYKDYVADYTKTQPGEYRSEASRSYFVDNKEYQFDVTEMITFKECTPAPDFYRVRHQGYYVIYNENELTTRFALISEAQPTTGDVCANHDCHYNADCIPKGDGFTCTCKQGYEGSGLNCIDLDECSTGLNTCSENATCTNTDGGYRCTCRIGFSGDGYLCAMEEGRKSCRDLSCHKDAECVYQGDYVSCICKPGYRGDGTYCDPVVVTCDEADICDSNAECLYNDETRRYECQCIDGFSGDGESCSSPPDASCAYCSFHAECLYNSNRLYYYCACLPGYTGDGRSCQLIEPTSILPPTTTTTTTTTPVEKEAVSKSCLDTPSLCNANSYCAAQGDGSYGCLCYPGFLRSGSECVEADCESHQECGANAHCQLSSEQNKYQCICDDGYQGDGQLCTTTAVTMCNQVNVCHLDADCYDTALGPKCVCRNGFIGDGVSCTAIQDNCLTRPALCDRNAVCSRTSAGDFVCICNPGYRGDGSTCSPLNEKGNYLLFSQGMSIFRVPFYQAGSDRGRRILFKSGGTLVGLAADCKDRQFYYSDISTGTISRASLDNSTDSHVIIADLGSPEGLAVDWISRTLFFTDSALDRIEVSDLEGKYRKVLIDSDLVNPRAITVDPIEGKIYWTDWNRDGPKIEAANTDGTDRQVIVDTGLGLPNGLTFDLYRQQVCWSDAGTQKLECVRPDGSGRSIIYDLANYPFGLATFRDNFYWTDWHKNAIQSIPRGGEVLGASMLFPVGGNGKAYSIEPVASQCLPGTNECTYNNGGCPFLCLPTSNYDSTCACPDNIDQDECNQIFKS